MYLAMLSAIPEKKLYGGGGGVGRPLLYIGYVYGGYFMAIADTCTCKWK